MSLEDMSFFSARVLHLPQVLQAVSGAPVFSR